MRDREHFMLITSENVCFGYDDKRILEHVDFTVSEGERIGLIGGNGEGKTTLIKLLTRQLEPDEGKITSKTNLKIGYLEQNGGFDSDKTVFEEMKSVFSRVFSAIDNLRSLEKEMAAVPFGSREYTAIAARYENLNKLIAAEDGYNAEVKIRTVLGGMGFEKSYDQIIHTMSGGEKTRLKLCRLLLEEPEILFLDEPTNHLDVSTLFWLEDYLVNYRGAIFTVSHDRYFLDKTAQKIFELERNRLTVFRGNYSKYKILKAEQYERKCKEYAKQQEEIADLKEYIAKNIVRATTAKSAQSRVKKLENMEMLEKPLPPPAPPVFLFGNMCTLSLRFSKSKLLLLSEMNTSNASFKGESSRNIVSFNKSIFLLTYFSLLYVQISMAKQALLNSSILWSVKK